MTIKQELKYYLLNIFKNNDVWAYNLYQDYIFTDMENIKKNENIEKRVLNLYLSSLTKYDLKRLKIINNCIKEIKCAIEYATLSTIYETYMIDKPEITNKKFINGDINTIGLRDNNGFYAINANQKKEFDEFKLEFDFLHEKLKIKEELMSGKCEIKKNMFNRHEVLILANYIGYGNTRKKILEEQNRNINKTLIKNKD